MTTKDQFRQLIWSRLADAGAADDPFDRIPAFEGAGDAAARLASLPEWREAGVVKAVPDRAQEPVRRLALEAGKVLYMAVPKLAKAEPFYRLHRDEIDAAPVEAAQNRRALELGRGVDVDRMQPVDLVILGSVVVNRRGVRIGKGAGYSDIEIALLTEGGLISDATPIVTTVHPLQVIDDELVETEHDYRVDLVVTPTDVIDCRPTTRHRPRPPGLVWDHMDDAKISAIPALQARRELRRRQ
jgi:5-formyltetrahydrofolate cyclo-ligase